MQIQVQTEKFREDDLTSITRHPIHTCQLSKCYDDMLNTAEKPSEVIHLGCDDY